MLHVLPQWYLPQASYELLTINFNLFGSLMKHTIFSNVYTALLLPYSLMGHSWGNQSLLINLWSRLVVMSHSPLSCALTLHWTETPYSVFYFFMAQDYLQGRHNIIWLASYQKGTLPSLHQRSLLLGCVPDLNREVLSLEFSFRYLRILITAAK